MKLNKLGLDQQVWCLSKRGRDKECEYTEERPYEVRERSHQKTSLPASCSWISSPQNCEKINFCSLSHWDILFWQLQQTNIPSLYINIYISVYTYVHVSRNVPGNSLAVQWLELYSFSAEGMGSILGWGSRIPQTAWHGQTKEKRKRK